MFLAVLEVVASVFGVLMSFGHWLQAWRLWQRKSSHDVSLWTYVIFSLGTSVWLAYGLVLGAWPIIIGFGFGVGGSVLSLILILKYR
ncbi:hypothetical protein KY327_00330 [Candidatus Woesearchaeota archaeon]|nr:hypothetical protein [Candidatus Woesearchaeota archaeon]